MRTLKSYKILSGICLIFTLMISCGKPQDPESINREGTYGGYSVVSRFQPSGYAQDLLIKDSLCYITQGEGGLMIVNVGDPEFPQMISELSEVIRGYSTKISMKDSAVFVATGSFGVTALNVGNPYQPMVSSPNLSIKPSKDFHVYGDYLFTSISEQGVQVANISFAIYPDVQGALKTAGYARGLTTSPDSSMLLIACGEMGLSIYDISDYQNDSIPNPFIGELLGWCDTDGYAEDVVVSNNQQFAYLACGTSGLQIIDYSDTSNVHIVGSYDTGGYAKEILLRDEKIYMTAETYGLQVIDVNDVTNPMLVGSVDTEYALGLDIDEKYIYIADEKEGLIIIARPD